MKDLEKKLIDVLLPPPEPDERKIYDKLLPHAIRRAEDIKILVDIATVEAELHGLIWVSNNCFISDGFQELSKKIQALQKKLKELKNEEQNG